MRLFQWYGTQLIGRVDKNVQDAIKQSIMLIQRDAKKDCPVDTGRLRASISSNWSGSGLSRGEVDSPAKSDDGVGQPGGTRAVFIGATGTNVEYAPYLELGTVKMGAQPYLRPAFDKYKDFRKYIRKI